RPWSTRPGARSRKRAGNAQASALERQSLERQALEKQSLEKQSLEKQLNTGTDTTSETKGMTKA
ncbi:MAG: hypothetical protein ACRDSE_16910, partial [Pseudonocardiaceae bacterium]